MNQDGDYTCTCASGYEGKNCTVGEFKTLGFFTILALIYILKSGSAHVHVELIFQLFHL